METNNKFLLFNRFEWDMSGFNWTQEELDHVDKNGFIGTRNGVDCYLAKPVKSR